MAYSPSVFSWFPSLFFAYGDPSLAFLACCSAQPPFFAPSAPLSLRTPASLVAPHSFSSIIFFVSQQRIQVHPTLFQALQLSFLCRCAGRRFVVLLGLEINERSNRKQ
jgi:hypothetical protein